MPRITHVAQAGTGAYPVIGDVVELTWLAADTDDFEQTPYTGREIILARNVSEDTAADVTITSKASAVTGRTGTLVKEVGFGEQICIGPLGNDGWRQSDGMIYFAGETTDIEFAVVRL